MTGCNPIYNMLIDVTGDSMLCDINKFALYRTEARNILGSKVPGKAKVLTEIAYRAQQVGILLPQPMEELDSKYFYYLDWILKDDNRKEVGTLVNVSSWYPVVPNGTSDNTILELEFENNDTVTITINGSVTNVSATKVDSKDNYNYFAVAWPKELGIKALVKLKDNLSYCYLELPPPDYNVSKVAEELVNSEIIINFLEDIDLIESFYLSDSDREKIAIVILAMYRSLSLQ